MIRCPINKLLVTIEKKYQDKQGKMFIDTTYNPEEYATLKGTVFSVPDRVDDAYYKGKIEALAKVGDEVWFSYSVVYNYRLQENGDTPVYKNLIPFNGEEYWMVNYEEVFCIVRDGEILVPTQHVLLEPVRDDRPAQSESGLFYIKESEWYEDRAKVVAVPNMKISCFVGDVVPIEPSFVQKYIIFDKPHYIIPTRRLIAKFN